MATVVKELNELAKKMTGINPMARTDQQALDFIEQNYNGMGTGIDFIKEKKVLMIPKLKDIETPEDYGVYVYQLNDEQKETLRKLKDYIIENNYEVTIYYHDVYTSSNQDTHNIMLGYFVKTSNKMMIYFKRPSLVEKYNSSIYFQFQDDGAILMGASKIR